MIMSLCFFVGSHSTSIICWAWNCTIPAIYSCTGAWWQ